MCECVYAYRYNKRSTLFHWEELGSFTELEHTIHWTLSFFLSYFFPFFLAFLFLQCVVVASIIHKYKSTWQLSAFFPDDLVSESVTFPFVLFQFSTRYSTSLGQGRLDFVLHQPDSNSDYIWLKPTKERKKNVLLPFQAVRYLFNTITDGNEWDVEIMATDLATEMDDRLQPEWSRYIYLWRASCEIFFKPAIFRESD